MVVASPLGLTDPFRVADCEVTTVAARVDTVGAVGMDDMQFGAVRASVLESLVPKELLART